MNSNTPSIIPPKERKTILILLIGGILILAAAGAIILFREVPDPAPKIEPVNAPPVAAPVVIDEPTRPLAVVSTDEETDTTPPPQPNSTAVKRGKLDPKLVNRFINERFEQVKACYERRLKTNPLLEGKLDLLIDVSQTGKVIGLAVNQDTVRDGEMRSCVRQIIRSWRFPQPVGGSVLIAKTFSFKKKL